MLQSPATQKNPRAYAQVPAKELAIFCRQMSLVIGSDITLGEGLIMVLEQSENRTLKKSIQAMSNAMNMQGYTFAQSMEQQPQSFPGYLSNMVTLGEQSGTLDIVLQQMADYYEKEHRMQRRVRAAITYPAMLAILMLAVIALLVLRILPMFEQILINMGGTLPAITQVMMTVVNFIVGNLWWILGAIVALMAIYALMGTTSKGGVAISKWRLNMPLMGSLRRRIITARFARSMAILLKSGVSIISALDTMGTLLGNAWLAEKLKNVQQKLLDGEGLSAALAEIKIFPPLFMRLVVIGDSTGRLDEMLFKAAGFFDDEVDEGLDRLTNAIEPILIIVLSIVVGIILLSVMLPMINIMSRIG